MTLICRIHPATTTICAHGRLRVWRGHSWLARVIATACRLPRANDAAEVRLIITPQGDAENWERTFDGYRLDTQQYRSTDGDLIERYGFFEFRFRLTRSDAGLLYAQRDVSLRISRFRLKIPTACAPRVEASEAAADDEAINVNVRVVLPNGRLLIAYDGTIHTDSQ